MSTAEQWLSRLSADQPLLDRTSTTERVADLLRQHIIDATLAPGTRLSEEKVGRSLGISRNTLREAFRLLAHERLLVHELHRGVFVRELDAGDVVDVYRLRRLIETTAMRGAATAAPGAIEAVSAAVREGERAAERREWHEVGTANMRFHQAVTALAGSDRANEVMRQLLAELRLAFHVMSPLRDFHQPYLSDNRAIADLLAEGAYEQAAQRLDAYFDVSERQLVEALKD